MKRMITLSLALMTAVSCCLTMASAVNAEVARASVTLSGYFATMKSGSRPGELQISYQVNANMSASSLGVSSIAIYKSDGTYITTITGTTGNGLIRNSSNAHRGTYSYTASSGGSYYAKVTVFASTSSVSDSRTVTTTTVTAP